MKLNVENLINKYGFPLYLYYEEQIKKNLVQLQATFNSFELLYSYKANPNQDIVTFLSERGIGADAASINEVKLANKVKVPKHKILYSSPGKVEEDIIEALDHCIIVANSYSELELINKVCGRLKNNTRTKVGIRINPNVEFDNDEIFEIMSGKSSQFGIDEETLLPNKSFIDSLEYIEIAGIHIYMGSGLLDYKLITKNFQYVFNVLDLCINRMKLHIEFVDFGGGFGVPYLETETKLDLTKLKENVDIILKNNLKFDPSNIRLIIESGRYLTANAGEYITKVVDIKESRGKKFVIVHGGMNGFFRPQFTKVNHPLRVYGKDNSEMEEVTICGNMCTPLDIMADNIRLPQVSIGDIIIFSNAGSYGYTMSLKDFISQRKPTEIYMKTE